MTKKYPVDHLMAGTIKFDSTVPKSKLIQIILDLRASRFGNRFQNLHFRGAGADGSHYIGLIYLLENEGKRTQNRATHQIVGFVKDSLQPDRIKGNRRKLPGFLGWSIATVEGMI